MLNQFSTAFEVKAADPDLAILPVGANEQHGPHLPLNTDALLATMQAEGVAEKMNAYLLPTVSITTSMEHRGIKGTVWVDHPTLYNYLADIVGSLYEQGFKKVLILYTHGGIKVVDPLIIAMNKKYKDMGIVGIRPGKLFYKLPEVKEVLETNSLVHACEVETSMIMYKHPELVRTELIEDCVPSVATECLNLGSIFDYSHNGVWGEPSKATAEKGKRVLEILIENTVKTAERYFKEAFGL